MKYAATVFIVVVAIFVGTATTAHSANYGCVSKAQCRQMEALVYQTFGNGYAGRCFIRIMYRESGGNPLAANYGDSHGGSFGLMQLNGVHKWIGESWTAFKKRMFNPRTHLQAALRLYQTSGFSPWGGCP